MKKFIWKIIGFVVTFGLILSGLVIVSFRESYSEFFAKVTNSAAYNNEPTKEIMPYLDSAGNSEDTYYKLIIGDSVCHQMMNPFQEYNDTYAILGNNAATTMVGQYLLAEKFIENHPETTDIYLILRAFPGGGFSMTGWTYQYLVIPFTLDGSLGGIDENTIEKLKEIYGGVFLEEGMIEKLDQSAPLKKMYLNSLENVYCDDVAIGIQYLEKLEKLCAEQGISLHLLHAPVSEDVKEEVWAENKRAISYDSTDGVKELLQEFYDSISYYPAEEFRDGIHFTKEKSSLKSLREYIRDIQNFSGELTDLKLE